jgi:uncharacterized protein (DUF1800 family)
MANPFVRFDDAAPYYPPAMRHVSTKPCPNPPGILSDASTLIEPLDDPHWAWQPYLPDEARPWNLAQAAHLYRRATCGGTWSELQRAVAEGPQATLDRLMAGGPENDSFYADNRRTMTSLLGFGDKKDLPAWWLFTMLATPHPLQERLTLFWHGHFATSAAKVTDQNLMFAQNELLRKHALGKFGDLLTAMMQDVAMLLWLDSAVNRKTRPNENFAREVMELFTLGTGHYTERDIKEAARCFTGWEVHNNRFWFNRPQHDDDQKQVLGERGNFDGDQLVALLLEQPACARFLVRKLFRFLIADEPPVGDGDSATAQVAGTPNSTAVRPSDEFIEPLARQLRESGYDIAGVVRMMLASNYFYSSAVAGRRIKGPVEFAVGLVRSLEGHVDHYALADDLAALGQQVFYPPNVKGWNGGRDWINAYTLLSRTNLVERLTAGSGRYERKLKLDECPALADAASDPKDGRALVERLCELLLAVRPPEVVVAQLAKAAERRSGEDEWTRRGRTIYALASLPEFQLL